MMPFHPIPRLPMRAPVLPMLLLSILTGCATIPPPTGELATARDALARAVEIDADQYARDPLARARRLLDEAQAALDAGQNRQARDLAALALASADLARASSRNTIAQTELEQRRRQLDELRQRLQHEELP